MGKGHAQTYALEDGHGSQAETGFEENKNGKGRKERLQVSGKALASWPKSLGPTSGIVQKKADIQRVDSSPQRWTGARGGQWAEGKLQASSFSARVPQGWLLFFLMRVGVGGGGKPGLGGGGRGDSMDFGLCFHCCGLLPSLGFRKQSGSCQLVLKQQSGKSKKVLEGFQKQVSPHACHVGTSSISQSELAYGQRSKVTGTCHQALPLASGRSCKAGVPILLRTLSLRDLLDLGRGRNSQLSISYLECN